jgi:lipoate synthase
MTFTEEQFLKNTRESFQAGREVGVGEERDRIIKLLTDLDVVRVDALGHWVAFNTHGTEVVYLTGLEGENK